MWGDPSPELTVERLQAFGIARSGGEERPEQRAGGRGGNAEHVPVPEVVEPVDAMAAGDGFNAGYLAARLKGARPVDAVMAAHRLAAQVIRHRGAIMPRVGGAVH